jgi:lipoyl-dependent peroxiredoxin
VSVDQEAHVSWKGGLGDGAGEARLESGVGGVLPVSWASRTSRAANMTSPEELIAAAHAACYSMALSHEISEAGATPISLATDAVCTFVVDDAGARIGGITLRVRGSVTGLDADAFAALADTAKRNCPVSRALAAVPISLDAQLA